MTLSEYSQLKQQIVFSVGGSEKHNHLLNILKNFFYDDINSPRRFEQIDTIGQLLKVLEIRDVLSEDNVDALKEIAKRLHSNDGILKRITDYQSCHVPRQYVNYYASASENIQDAINREPTNTVFNHVPCSGGISKRKKERINETIIEEIGIFWRDLGRNLKIRECVIDEINSSNTSLASKAIKLMEFYEKRADPQRWFFVLCEALDKTRRKDISVTLQDIMSMNI